jgi:hypothetical protein
VTLELLASGIFLITGAMYYLECAARSAVLVEVRSPPLAPVRSPAELAWYYRPAEVFLRQVIHARSRRGFWYR